MLSCVFYICIQNNTPAHQRQFICIICIIEYGVFFVILSLYDQDDGKRVFPSGRPGDMGLSQTGVPW